MQLFNVEGALLAEGAPGDGGVGEQLSLAATRLDQVYALQVTPQADIPEQVFSLVWDPSEATRVSTNLIRNPGAEDGQGSDSNGFVEVIPNWNPPDEDIGTATVIFYNSPEGNPTSDGPGPADRGFQLFAGGPSNSSSGLQQTITLDPAWQQVANEGRAKFRFTAFLGGNLTQGDSASASLTFYNANLQPLGEAVLPAVTPLDRGNATGLLPAETSDYVPAGTFMVYVKLFFRRAEGNFNDGYADSLELVLSEFPSAP
jgi:hypothetical protein